MPLGPRNPCHAAIKQGADGCCAHHHVDTRLGVKQRRDRLAVANVGHLADDQSAGLRDVIDDPGRRVLVAIYRNDPKPVLDQPHHGGAADPRRASRHECRLSRFH